MKNGIEPTRSSKMTALKLSISLNCGNYFHLIRAFKENLPIHHLCRPRAMKSIQTIDRDAKLYAHALLGATLSPKQGASASRLIVRLCRAAIGTSTPATVKFLPAGTPLHAKSGKKRNNQLISMDLQSPRA
ncbi:hypothetical protein [Burkholderia sp. Cy-637]|uniref:hypothetical protein n=1 Tax=Burkholderia sp. Cy-637 TaxID=2608327 RepID=UPI00141FF02F|nr:hypothetical protein [Burkholderia sp. Cy-637]NIF90480.1 hypothetical protein [Burkholderia sp. Cy-637]